MAARPTTRHPAASIATRQAVPAAPRVRDFSGQATGYAIVWDVRSVYDFLFSLNEDDEFPHDLLDEDRAWRDAARADLLAAMPDDAPLISSEIAIMVAAVAVEHPEVTTVEAFLDVFESTPTPALLSLIMCELVRDADIGATVSRAIEGDREARVALDELLPEHKIGFRAILDDPEVTHERLTRILRAWAAHFARIEPRIRAVIERDHGLRAADRGAYAGSELIERTTGGIRWLPEVGIRRVVLAPTYFSRPYNILLAGEDWRFFGYPVADDALDADDRLAPPAAVVRLHRALGDETRLRILKLLAGQDLYLTEIAQQLDLSKPTIKHHLAQLRSAGLVTVVEAGTVIYYSLRRDRIEAASRELSGFLVP
ncbi:MAG TPA: metalloregulator ArsR/SmtB family transcription factor [Candidatus Limnocylindrales bacterium]